MKIEMIRFDPEDFVQSYEIMEFLELLRTNQPLDEMLKIFKFRMVYHIMKRIAEDGKISNTLIKDGSIVKENAVRIFSEIQEKFPITQFPEKYI